MGREYAMQRAGVTPLKDAIRVLNGFGRSLEVILPKLRDGYLVEDCRAGSSLASEHGHAYFLTPEGECFHNATVTGGKPASAGPLALKRELRETEGRLDCWKEISGKLRWKPPLSTEPSRT